MATFEHVNRIQKELGNNIDWYYGSDCNKCCGVFPKYCVEDSNRAFGYYKCEVCGREGMHGVMPWVARTNWNNKHYKVVPEEFKQMTIYDFIKQDSTTTAER